MAEESSAVSHIPWETRILPLAQAGLQLAKPLTNLDPTEASRLTNLVPLQGGGFATRPGLTAYLAGGTNVHSIYILSDAKNNTFALFWGADATLVRTDAAGNPTVVIGGGFSGKPITLVPAKPPQAAETWMYIADTGQIGKITRTGAVQNIGFPIPVAPTVAVTAPIKTALAAFDASDNTSAAFWTPFTIAVPITAAPFIADIATPRGNNAVSLGFALPLSSMAGGMGIVLGPIDLTALPGAVAASDDDIIHFFIRCSDPSLFDTINLYFVTSPIASASVVPGMDNTGVNRDAYWISIPGSRLNDAAAASQQNVPAAAETLSDITIASQTTDPPTTLTGGFRWVEFGRIGVPLRRGDFQLVDPTSTRTWATVTGIIVTIQLTPDALPAGVSPAIALDDLYLTGGFGPDTSEPLAQPYDYRTTNFDPATGAEGNPSAVLATALFVDALRQPIVVTPAVAGLVGAKQRLYRRGGQNVDNWYFIGQNAVDGQAITDTVTDANAVAAGAVEIDHDQPVTSVDASGNALLAQPVRVFFGPIDDVLLALGDSNRPGDVYWSKTSDYDAWPPGNHVAVCPAGEELMNGVRWGGQGFVFSRERGYSLQVNLDSAQAVSAVPTDCSEGMAGYWGLATCPLGIAFVSLSGVRVTAGGASKLLSLQIDPLFHGKATNGYNPIDFTARDNLRLACVDTDLWFGYKDTQGALRWLVYSFITQTWRAVNFAVNTNAILGAPLRTAAAIGDPGTTVFLGGNSAGTGGYTHAGTTDAGTAIACNYRSGSEDFGRAEEKLCGEFFVEGDMTGITLTGQAFLNAEVVADTAQAIGGLNGYQRYMFEPFGTQPQHARSLAIDLSWSATAGSSPSLARIGLAFQPQPEIILNRPTAWDAPAATPIYLYGCWIDSDTGGSARTIAVEGMQDGTLVTLATVTVTSSAGRRQWFSWPAQRVDLVRLRGTGVCEQWLLFGCKWVYKELPDFIAGWDTQGEVLGDSYITGVDVVVDTVGVAKDIDAYVDGVLIKSFSVTAAGKRLIHLTFDIATPLRGHIGRIVSTDATGVKGLLYSWKWIYEAEPGEQYNLNQGLTEAGSLTDKWWKGVILEIDTFNQAKSVVIEIDGVTDHVETVQTNGRKIVNLAWPQILGRIFRVYATDTNLARLYTAPEFLFDEEPFALDRFETQELTCGVPGWKILPFAEIAVKSTASVTLTLTVYGDKGQVVATDSYVIASTGGVKQSIYVPFIGRKGYLYKFVFDGAGTPFWLYREESIVWVQPLGGSEVQEQRPFGDDDLDLVRAMRNPSLVAARGGGGSAQ